MPAASASTESPAVKAGDVLVPAEASAGEAMQIAIDACLDHLAPNEAGWLATEHPDHLHQTRVSTRRLRALLSLSRQLIRDDPVILDIKSRLRLLLVPLGPARDIDVALQRARDEEWSGEDIERLERARTRTYAAGRRSITSPAWHQVWSDLGRWRSSPTWLDHVADLRDGPARRVSDAALDRRYRRIMLAGPVLLSMSDHALHRVRIEAKKLRYGCQFFDGLYPGAGSVSTEDGGSISVPLHFAETVAVVQDAFGLFNDYAEARHLRAELGLVSGEADEPPTRLDCVTAWLQVADLEPFWRVS